MLERAHAMLESISRRVDAVAALLTGLLVIAMFAIIFLQVVCRYVTGAALSWPEEVTMFLMAWLAFVGSSVALRRSAHIGVDVLPNLLSGCARSALMLLIRLLVLVFSAFLIKEGLNLVNASWDVHSDGLRLCLAYPRLAMPVGGSLLLLHSLAFLLGDIMALRAGPARGQAPEQGGCDG